MSSSTTPDKPAIRINRVSKVYQTFASPRDQIIGLLGLDRLGFRFRSPPHPYVALDDINLIVPKGRRIGIIGRNGAGKTTLLKLICGNYTPTCGEIEVNGTVQALMSTGIGFHPEMTGRQNATASLHYNGISPRDHTEALQGIIEFCELDDYFDQPFKTYSLGMQARLMFAAATAIKPDILIVDEVLGAGDAYFVAKSRRRVEQLINNGCTLLLVSHSLSQVLELCSEAVWLERGKIRMNGEAFSVVKAYEEFIHGYKGGNQPQLSGNGPNPDAAAAPLHPGTGTTESTATPQAASRNNQEPAFTPNAAAHALPFPSWPTTFAHVARGDISRWQSEAGLKVTGFSILTEGGYGNILFALRPASILLTLTVETTRSFRCRYGIAISDHLGRSICAIWSPRDEFTAQMGELRRVSITLNPCQIGPGDYVIGVSVLEYGPLEQINATARYDLLGRSFCMQVRVPDSLTCTSSGFYHSAEWHFESN